MSEGSGGTSSAPQSLPSTPSSAPLAAEVDESPLQKTMDKNKESLKVKLMMRRPINQLVAQGIMPSLKTPPAFHEQRQKLERAKMGDLLKAKIQQRPDREELVRQHILEADVTHVDPSLADRQRMLKKARLADSLNDQLSHRPGPLELIKKNILHTEEPIERAVKEGVIPFKATSEGQLRKPQHPDHYITFEDDSQSSEGGGSPSNTPASFANNSLPTLDNIASSVTQNKSKDSPRGRDVLETAAANAGIVNVAVTIPTNAVVVTSPILQQIPNDKSQTLQTFAELCSSVVSPLSLGSSTSSLSPLSSIASPPTPLTPRPTPLSTSSSSSSSAAPGKADKNRKKSKTKTQPKTRTIKFHEYKGPPNAQKNTPSSASSTETSYELLLQQQQLFLQWQLEWQHKYPQIILPAAQKPSNSNDSLQNTISTITNAANNAGTTFLVTQSSRASTPVVQATQANSKPPSSPPQAATEPQATTQIASSAATNAATLRVLTKLEDMKVSDLKVELKKRNLPVSGPKPQLIERLKPFTQPGENGAQQSGEGNGLANASRVPTGENPGSVVSEMEVAVSPSNVVKEDDAHFSPNAKTSTPPPASPAPSAMDTSEATPPLSPTNGDTIIQQQQRKIEELQRELQKSQQQLQQIRQGKETTTAIKNSTPPAVSSSTIPVKALFQNGIIRIDSKSQQKLLLQQHLQNKIQQQQLQVQLQQLQQQQNEAVNAKANLAAFINQQQAQQQLNSLLQAANNNNNNDSVTSNNLKNKLTGKRSIVLGQHQAAIVLNHLVKKNGILGHQRTSSLPAFLGTLVENVDDKEKKKRAGSEEQAFIVTKPPPGYKEATKIKDEDEEEKKNVKSQIVDDVLEILIKNGELPPSAANDPATPTTPGRSCDPEKGLIYPPAPPPPPPPPPLPHPGFSVTLPTSITLPNTFATNSPFTLTPHTVNPPTYTLTQAYVTSSERENIPPVNNITFSISNPTYDNNKNFSSGYLDVMSTDNADFDMNNANDQNFHSSTLDYILSSNDNLLSSELSSSDNMLPTEYANGDINLKELGLDLETLDTMDFSQLDCKMDTSESEMDTGPSDAAPIPPTTTVPTTTTTTTTNKTDQLINNNPELVKPEMIEPMDMDDNWLDSLMPLSETHSSSLNNSNGYDYDNSYESMLGTGQDPFELFDLHDNDFKLPSSSLSWDKVDFAT